jgi:hypothetical protein
MILKGQVEIYKARLIAKGFSQRKGLIIKIHSHLFLPRTSFEWTSRQLFLNRNLYEDVYMMQPDSFQVSGKEYMVCKLKISIYGLKEASRYLYLKFNEVVASYGFKENSFDQCIDLRVIRRKYILLMLFVDDKLLAANDNKNLLETNHILFSHFDMWDFGERSYVLGI